MARKKPSHENMHGVGAVPHQTKTQANDLGDKPNKTPFDQAKFQGMAAQIAGSTVSWGNARFKNAEKHFPFQPHMRSVGRFYPYYKENGKDVGLYVDEPMNDSERKECEQKAKALALEGLRYVIIDKANMTLEDVRKQLEPKKASA